MTVLRDEAGAAWEKRGNTIWLDCPACGVWFPITPALLHAAAPPCHCPQCHHEFRPSSGEEQ